MQRTPRFNKIVETIAMMSKANAAQTSETKREGKRMFGARSLKGLVLASAVSLAALALAGCVQEDGLPRNSRHYVPLPAKTLALMSEKNMTKDAPILIRTYKQESEFEVWKKTSDGKYAHLKTFPMCRWSGQLGPKTREGDRQVPEGFYAITPGQLNPNSNYYLSFNVGYPNQLDKAYGRGGGLIMVHGACSSAGCLSMTDDQVAEIYALTREAFAGGQQQVQMQSMPFRMTAHNLAKFRADPNIAFWKNLKEGSDHFEVTKQEPKVGMCGKKYVFDANSKGTQLDAAKPCPALETDTAIASLVEEKKHSDDVKVAELVSQGVKAVRRTYVDGDQHPSFRTTATSDGTVRTRSGNSVEVSQINALAVGATEVAIEDSASRASIAPKAVKGVKPAPAALASAATPVPAVATEEPAAGTTALALASETPVSTPPATPSLSVASVGQSLGASFNRSWIGSGSELKSEAPIYLAPVAAPSIPAAKTPMKAALTSQDAAKASPAKASVKAAPKLPAGKVTDGKVTDGKAITGKSAGDKHVSLLTPVGKLPVASSASIISRTAN